MKTQKIKTSSRVYGVLGMLGILLFGMMMGFIMNGASRPNPSSMTVAQCQSISNQIVNAAQNNNPDLLRQLNQIFSENCIDRSFKHPKQKPVFKSVKAHMVAQKPSCEKIESVLLQRLKAMDFDYSDFAQDYIERAKVYANLADKGCKENAESYKELAKQDLEIARALNQDRLDDRVEATEMVETYKRLQMKAEAEKMIEKAKKLTNPAIDFIIQLEKIIEE